MTKPISKWQTTGFIFTSILGTLLHFLFDWTGGSLWTATISAVNESIWEHMKLIFVPMVVFAWIQRRHFPELAGFWWVKLVGILCALALIPVLYYTYTGALGISVDWFNIAIFFIAAGVAFWLEARLFDRSGWKKPDGLAMAVIVILGALFLVFTFWPPRIPLFQDPQDGSFGFRK